jgi:hypothetical protein
MLVVAGGGRGAPHARATCLTVIAINHGRGPLKALLAPLSVAFDALLSAMGGDVGRRLPVVAWGCLPASLGRVKHDRLVAGGALGGDAAWLLKLISKEVVMSVLSWDLRITLGQHASATLASVVVSLGLTVPALPP